MRAHCLQFCSRVRIHYAHVKYVCRPSNASLVHTKTQAATRDVYSSGKARVGGRRGEAYGLCAILGQPDQPRRPQVNLYWDASVAMGSWARLYRQGIGEVLPGTDVSIRW